MAAQMRQRFRDLPDVDWASFEDGEVATYDEAEDKLTGEEGGGGAGVDLAAHVDDETDVHGITDTTLLLDGTMFSGPGELITATGNDEPVRLASGADGQVLTTNLSEPKGLEWLDPDVTAAELAAHNADTTNVHGIINTSELATDAELTAHASDATGVHGITDTAALATDAEVATAVAAHESDTSVHGIADTTALATDAELASGLAAKQSTSEKGQANGYASLGADAKIPTGQIAAIALTDVNVVASQAAQLALTAEEGDVAVRSDETQSYVHNGGTAGTMADWTLLQTPAGAVLSVNGETGAVTLDAADVGAASTSALSNHEADTTSIHGITDTAALATDAEVATAVSDHSADTTSVHGITDTTALATDAEVATAVSDHSADTTSVHGVADTSVLATDAEVATAVSDHSADTTSVHGIADTTVLATDAEVATAVSDHSADTTAVHGIADTSALASLPIAEANVTGLTAALAAKQPLDSDLTSLAALTTTSFGRGLLELANQGALLTAAGAAASTHAHAESDVTNLVTDLAAKASTTHASAHADGGADELVTALDPLTFPSALKLDRAYVTGQYYPACITALNVGGVGVPTTSRTYYTQFIVWTTTTFDRIAIYITVNGTATCVHRLGIFNDNNGVPGTVLLDAGTVATDSGAAVIKAITISQQLTPGRYWAAANGQVATAATMARITPFSFGTPLSAAFNSGQYYTDSVTGAFANSPAVAVAAVNAPLVGLRAA